MDLVKRLPKVLCFGSPQPQDTMHITKTQAFTVENLCFINLPTYDHGRLVVTEGSPNSGEVDHRLEIDGISQKAWRAEIHNFTRCQGL